MRRISNLKFKTSNSQSGQALITLLFFVLIGTIVITATVIILFINNLSANTTQQGTAAYYLAESGAEDGYLRLLRNPNLTVSNQILTVGSGTVNLSVSNNGPTIPFTITVTSIGTISNTVRKIQAQAVYNSSGTISISSWKEIN